MTRSLGATVALAVLAAVIAVAALIVNVALSQQRHSAPTPAPHTATYAPSFGAGTWDCVRDADAQHGYTCTEVLRSA